MQDVRFERYRYIGGSDIPVILGISPFKTRYQLLLEKAQITEQPFVKNKYTEFGNLAEESIRNYINNEYNYNFIENKTYKDYFRYHSDGFDDKKNTVLEVKTTGGFKANLSDYKGYISQLLLGMHINNVREGLLVVYKRPSGFENTEQVFVTENDIEIYKIDIDYEIDGVKFIDTILEKCDKFMYDLDKVKNAFIFENKILEEIDLLDNDIEHLSYKLIDLKKFKKSIEESIIKIENTLLEKMQEEEINTFNYNNAKITFVKGREETTYIDIDLDKLKQENEELIKKYEVEKIKKASKGFIKITEKKEVG